MLKAIGKVRDDNLIVTEYLLEDNKGLLIRLKPDKLIKEINNGTNIENIELSDDNKIKLLYKQENVTVDVEEQINKFKNLLPKLKLMGNYVEEITEEDGNKVIIASLNENNHYMYISDGVLSTANTRNCIKELKGKIIVLGGNDLVNVENLFSKTQLNVIDISCLCSHNVSIADGMFTGSKVSIIKGVEYFDTSSLTSMKAMFADCVIDRLDLTSWTRNNNLVNIEGAFLHSRMHVLNLRNFDASKVKNLMNMFNRAMIGRLNLTNFQVKNCDYTDNMFRSVFISEIVADGMSIYTKGCPDKLILDGGRYTRIDKITFNGKYSLADFELVHEIPEKTLINVKRESGYDKWIDKQLT